MSKIKSKQISTASGQQYSVLINDGTLTKWTNGLDSSLLLPCGTTGARPSLGTTGGYIRFNNSTTNFEGYNGSSWNSLISGITISQDSVVLGTTIQQINFTGSLSANVLGNLATINVTSSGSLDSPVNLQTSTSYNIVSGDKGKLISFKNTANISVTLPSAGGSFGNGWYVDLMNRGSSTDGFVILSSASNIDETSGLILAPGKGARIFSDGSSYYTNRIRGPQIYQFRINFDSVPNVATSGFFSNNPVGWTCTRDGIASVTITHNLAKPFALVQAMGYNGTTYTQRFPNTASGGSTFAAASNNSNNSISLTGLTLTNTSVTANQHIIFTVMFAE